MKTTFNIDDTVMARLKREAVHQGRTMSELVETALRMMFRSSKKRGVCLPCRHSVAVVRWSTLQTETLCITPWKGVSVRRYARPAQ